jgi:hypothetical protein
MKLDKDVNYIVSGLERSGTSMLMQILKASELPLSFDENRKPDENNPKGYYELEGGKIINKLMDGSFPLEKFKGKFIKITAFGLKYLPPGKYKIIYSERNIEEILDSMEKMIEQKDLNREKTKESFIKLNAMIKQIIQEREDIDVLFVNYNNILSNPKDHIEQIINFLELSKESLNKMLNIIDNRLYRQRRKETNI